VLKMGYIGSQLNGKAVVIDACQANGQCGVSKQPRALLKLVEGLEILELPKQGLCCGFGGTFSVKSETLSVSMAKELIDQILSTGAQYVISTDYTCLIQLDSVLKKQGIQQLELLHIAEVLAKGI
jgi:L-lactate dehydrogenase complex protein LldE